MRRAGDIMAAWRSECAGRGQRGASMVIALVLLLVCTVVAAVILSAAGANAERTGTARSSEQAYLACVSALGAAEDLVCGDGSLAGISITKSGSEYTSSGAASSIASWAAEQAATLDNATGTSTVQKAVTVDGFTGSADMPPVRLTFTMTSSKGIHVAALPLDPDDPAKPNPGYSSGASILFSAKTSSNTTTWEVAQ